MKVQADRLKEIAIHILRGLCAAEEEASIVAEALIKAELRGIDTHGVHRWRKRPGSDGRPPVLIRRDEHE